MALALTQIEKHTHKLHCCPREPAAADQDRQPPVERRPGQGRAGQGRVQWLVVVVVAASETVRLSWLVLLTVDSLSSVDLTSQGFFYIPACAFVCRGTHVCTQKKSLCVYGCISRLGDVTRRKQIRPLRKTKAFLLAFESSH